MRRSPATAISRLWRLLWLAGVVALAAGCGYTLAGSGLVGVEKVAIRTFGLKDRFYPSLAPDPETLNVTVNGLPCFGGWTWNPASGAVVFDEDAACFPQFDDVIEIEYDVYCAVRD